jgi:hypothetical protein
MSFSSSPVRRSVAVSGAVLAFVVLGGLTCASAEAGTLTRVTETFSDPFGGSFSCDGFEAHYVGQDHGFVTNWYDANGDPVRQEGQISAIETDTNESTGATVVVRTQLNVHVDYATDTQSVTGIRNLSNDPGRGVVIQSVGRLTVTASEGELISLHGPADDINLGGGFCEALAG